MVQKSGDHQLRLVVYPIIYRVLLTSQVGFLAGFLNHQQYHLMQDFVLFRFHETCSHGHNVSQACEHGHTSMLHFHIAPATKRQGVIRFGKAQGVPKTHGRLDAQLIFKGRGASVETIRRSKETILHLKKWIRKNLPVGV